MPLPTDKQREQWDRFAAASKESADETDDLDGMERSERRAALMREKLDGRQSE